MDTINEIEPVGSDGATPSPDTSSVDTQPTESADSVSDGKTEEVVEAPTLLAGKYKSQQELEKAYQELEEKLGEQGQKAELANLLEKTTGMNSAQIKDYLTQQQYAQYQAQVQDNPGLAAFNEVQQLRNELTLQQEQQELNKFLSSEDGKPYQDFKDKIFNLKQNLERDKDYGEIARDYFGKAIAKGQEVAYKKIDTKIMTQVTGTRSVPQKKFSTDDLKNMSIAEMEQILPRA